MLEEDVLLDEQLRKKKRFVLLALFTLLLLGLLAALPLMIPATPPPQAVAEAEVNTPVPKQSPSPPLDVSTNFPPPTSSATAIIEMSPPAATTVSPDEKRPSASPGLPIIAEASPDEVHGDEWQEPDPPPSTGVENTPGAAIILTATLAAGGNQGAANIASSTPDRMETFETPLEPTASINDLPRVHEIWEPIGEAETLSTVAASATVPLTSTIGLTSTAAISETELMLPPDGLPVTGMSRRSPLNWAAVIFVVLLLGAGITTLCYPSLGRR